MPERQFHIFSHDSNVPSADAAVTISPPRCDPAGRATLQMPDMRLLSSVLGTTKQGMVFLATHVCICGREGATEQRGETFVGRDLVESITPGLEEILLSIGTKIRDGL